MNLHVARWVTSHLARVVVTTMFIGSPLAAQGVITLAVGGAPTMTVAPGAKLAVPVMVDMSRTTKGMNLAAITTSVAWDNARLAFDSLVPGPFGQMSANKSKTGSGTAMLSAFNVRGATETTRLVTFFFTAAAAAGPTFIRVAPSVAGNETGTAVLSHLRARNLTVCVQQDARKCVGAGDD